MKSIVYAGLLAAALATGACAGFEQTSTSLVGPSPTPSPAPAPAPTPAAPAAPSLVGTWTSNPIAGISASSCTGFSWQVTSQTATSISGTFSATCANGISGSGTAAGQIDGSSVPYTVTGTASLPGNASCQFSLSGTATIVDSDTLRIPYSGSTCLGPVQGEETLRRPARPAPAPDPTPEPAPSPSPAPAPAPAESPYHVPAGPQTMGRAEQVVNATADEFRHLLAPFPTDGQSIAAAEELLRRMIWHLQHAGFQSGRQKNPSGAVSNDKLTVFADGSWHAVDVFYDYGVAGKATRVIFLEVFPASPLADGGIPD